MYELKKKIGKVLTSKSVGTGPSSYEKKNLPGRGLTKDEKHCYRVSIWIRRMLRCYDWVLDDASSICSRGRGSLYGDIFIEADQPRDLVVRVSDYKS